jgi:hypothetical protein
MPQVGQVHMIMIELALAAKRKFTFGTIGKMKNTIYGSSSWGSECVR